MSLPNLQESKKYSTGGHINPVAYFYLAHSLSEIGFEKVNVSIDKKQTSSLIGLIFLWLPVKIFGALAFRKERIKYQTIDNIFDVRKTSPLGPRRSYGDQFASLPFLPKYINDHTIFPCTLNRSVGILEINCLVEQIIPLRIIAH